MHSIRRTLVITGMLVSSLALGSATQKKLVVHNETKKTIDWREEKTTGEVPSGRGGGKLIPVGDQLVAIGGFHECFDKDKAGCDNIFFSDIFILDTKTNHWTKKQPKNPNGELPGARVFLGGASYPEHKTAIIYGGTKYHVNVTTAKPYPDTSTIKVYDDMWEYDPAKDTFTKINYANEGPGARLGAEIVIKDNMLYLFGGYDSSFKNHNDLWSFNLTDKQWKKLKEEDDPKSPSKRYIFRFELDDKGENIYLFGGNYREKATVQRKDFWKYNIPNNQFTEIISEKDSNISGRTHGAAASFADDFLIALGDIPEGGCNVNQASEQQNPTNEVWITHTNKTAPQWEQVKIGNGPSPLKRVFYAKVNGRLYVTLGYDYQCKNHDLGEALYNVKTFSLPLSDIGKKY